MKLRLVVTIAVILGSFSGLLAWRLVGDPSRQEPTSAATEATPSFESTVPTATAPMPSTPPPEKLAYLVTRDEYTTIAEYDALFIRETTNIDNHTFRFARKATSEGLVVIDDPISILRCTNKVYQAELFLRNGIPSPRTFVVHEGNRHEVAEKVARWFGEAAGSRAEGKRAGRAVSS